MPRCGAVVEVMRKASVIYCQRRITQEVPMGLVGAAGVGYLTAKRLPKEPLVSQCSSELTQVLRSFLTATKDNKPAMMPSNQIGLVGIDVAVAEATTTPVSVPPIASCRNSKQLSLALTP